DLVTGVQTCALPIYDGSMSERQQYYSLLTERTAAIKAADDQKAQVAAAPPKTIAAGKQAHQCDVLAAHPDDPNRASEGIADEKKIGRASCRERGWTQ